MSMQKQITSVKDILTLSPNKAFEDQITVAGWVKTVRFGNKGTLAFIKLNDGSFTTKELQIIYEKKDNRDWSFFEGEAIVTTGSCIQVTGKIVNSPGREQSVEMQAEEVIVLGPSYAEKYPVMKTNLTLEY